MIVRQGQTQRLETTVIVEMLVSVRRDKPLMAAESTGAGRVGRKDGEKLEAVTNHDSGYADKPRRARARNLRSRPFSRNGQR